MEWKTIIVAHIFVCVSKCLAMSRNELEDFVEFIQKTSHLDEALILKKGSRPGDESDEDEPVSEHAWEESGKFEGDLILSERQRRVIIQDVAEGLARNGLTDSTKRWPDNEVIYYIQKEHFSSDQVQAIQDGIDDLARASCVKFRPYRKGDRDAVVVQGSRRGCFSQVGYQGGYQVLNLSGRHPVGRGCFRHGTVVHEFLHTLGFFHMQSSPDRDDYIDVFWHNIIEPAKHNFRKYNTFSVSDFGVGYDYDSVLHYSRKAFSSNGGDTLVPKQGGASIGQRIGLSDKDVKKLNKMYCDGDSDSRDEVLTEDSADSKAPKTINKKKSINKPFTGHGIGYHQGKTVVIKLPTAETYKLPTLPTFHMFDYFSKTPQTVSPATIIEGFEVEKGINYNYIPSTVEEESNTGTNNVKYNSPYVSDGYEGVSQSDHYAENHTEVKKATDATTTNDEPQIKSAQGIQESSTSRDFDIDEAFKRLTQVIKSEVYPSQERHYGFRKSAYNPFSRTIKIKTSEPEIKKVEAFHESLPLSDTTEEKADEYLSQQFIKGLSVAGRAGSKETQDIESISAPYSIKDKLYVPKEIYSSYGMAFPFRGKIVKEDEKFVTPEYARIGNLRQKHNYTNLYKPVMEDNNESPFTRPDALSSKTLPVNAKSQEKGDTSNENYDVQEYTYHPLQENAFAFNPKSQGFKLQLESGHRNVHLPPEGKAAYKLFGFLVPITQNWYKTDYDTHIGKYSENASGSHEDHKHR